LFLKKLDQKSLLSGKNEEKKNNHNKTHNMIAFSGFLLLIGFGIFVDLAFNEGEGIATIFRSVRGDAKIGEITIEDDKVSFAKMLLEEIAALRDDLEYDQSPEEKQTILDKIRDREKILEKLF
jgi:hypothetical protein